MDNNIKAYILEESAISCKPEILTTSTITDGPVKIKAILQDADNPNRNKRAYTKRGLLYGISTPYAKERLERKAWYGECGPVKL